MDDTRNAFGGVALTSHEELFALAENLKKVAEDCETDQIKKPLAALEEAAQTIGRSFSGLWQGYHSRVYYDGFSPPPPGAHFSQEWGLMDTYRGKVRVKPSLFNNELLLQRSNLFLENVSLFTIRLQGHLL